MFKVRIDARNFQNAADKLARNLEEADTLMQEVGNAVVSDVSRRVATADGGSWAPASRWVQAKKGTSQALVGLENDFGFRHAGRNKVEVYFDGQNSEGDDIDIQEHNDGTTLSATGEVVDLDLVNPSALRLSRPNFSFRWLKDSVIPARKIWPNEQEVRNIVAGPLSRYLQRVRNGSFN